MSEVSDFLDTEIAVASLITGESEAAICYDRMRYIHEWLKNGFTEEDMKLVDKIIPANEREEFLKLFNQARKNYVHKEEEVTEQIDRDLFILGASVGLL
ncbi:MAG: hypothetical protein Q8K86_07315 [Candidatus Nanopelagicaceae bacterium]|nr:hypothetical protein [Candidatus Nanopelagicaceae bacterium]